MTYMEIKQAKNAYFGVLEDRVDSMRTPPSKNKLKTLNCMRALNWCGRRDLNPGRRRARKTYFWTLKISLSLDRASLFPFHFKI